MTLEEALEVLVDREQQYCRLCLSSWGSRQKWSRSMIELYASAIARAEIAQAILDVLQNDDWSVLKSYVADHIY